MELTLEHFARLVANLYRAEPDDCVLTLGDWQPSPVPGDREPLFHGTIRVTVGDFRRWAPDHVRSATNPLVCRTRKGRKRRMLHRGPRFAGVWPAGSCGAVCALRRMVPPRVRWRTG